LQREALKRLLDGSQCANSLWAIQTRAAEGGLIEIRPGGRGEHLTQER
jgi:hypothetical protein